MMTAYFQTTHSHSPLPFLVLSPPPLSPCRTWSCQTLSPRSSKISWRGCCRETFPRGWAVRARGTSHTPQVHISLISVSRPRAFWVNPSLVRALPAIPFVAGGWGRNAGRLCLCARIETDITWSIKSRGSWLISLVPSFHISLWLKLSDGSLSAADACLNNVTRESCGKYCHLVDNVETQIKRHPSPSFLPPLCHEHTQSPRGEGAPVFQRHWLAAGVLAEGEEASFVLCAAGLKKEICFFFCQHSLIWLEWRQKSFLMLETNTLKLIYFNFNILMVAKWHSRCNTCE